MKVILKKCLIVILLICILVPALFSGFALAADADVRLTQERAGNYASNFAINFYENWSSIGVVEGEGNRKGGFASSVVEGTFLWPLVDAMDNVTSEFGPRSLDNHKGMDFGVDKGTSIYSSCGGTIIDTYSACSHNYPKDGSCGCGGGYGNNVKVDCGNGIVIIYGHCTDIFVSVGDHVKQGQEIATVGCTGWSTGNHLHFEFMTNDINGIPGEDYIIRSTWYGCSYSVNPRCYIKDDASFNETVKGTSTSNMKVRGEVKTEYDPNATAESVKETDDKYKFNNISWINFVYRKSLKMNVDVIVGNEVDSKYFDDKEKIFGKELVEESGIINISKLLTEGRILPGDILYITDGKDGGEYVLYVGGTKIIYATPPIERPNIGDEKDNSSNNSALKYEYLHHYLEKIKQNLISEQENNSNIPAFGVTSISRLNETTANSIREKDANLIYNGKGYYSYSKYNGIPVEITTSGSQKSTWLFSTIKQIAKFLINLILYIIKMQVVGWANLVENAMQVVILGITGNYETRGIEALLEAPPTSSSGKRVTVESIFFNKIPILDANFFDFENAGGYSLKKEVVGPVQPGEESLEPINDPENIVYVLRQNLVNWYNIIRNLSIALMLFILIYMGIRIAISSSSEKKADYKKALTSWLVGFIVVLFIHLFMYVIMDMNKYAVNLLENLSQTAVTDLEYKDETVDTLVKQSNQELNLYDAVRIKAYSWDFTEAMPATIIYLFLIYLLIRFILIYLKRLFTIYILAITGSFMGVKYALEKIGGKKSGTLNKWFKEYAFNVLLQTVHAFLYVLYMSVALSVAETSLAGFLVCLVILNAMLKADKIFMKIFGLDKAGSLSDVDKPESWRNLVMKFYPMAAISGKMFTGTREFLFGKRGLVTEIRYLSTGKDNYKDAQKELDKRDLERMGKRWEFISSVANLKGVKSVRKLVNKLPIRKIPSINMYKALLSKDISVDTKKNALKAIKQAKTLKHAKFKRRVQFLSDMATGTFGMGFAVGAAIENPVAGFAAFQSSKKKIDKYRTLDRNKKKNSKYGISRDKAKLNYNKAKSEYNTALNTHTENEINYQAEKEVLLEKLRNAAGDAALEKAYKDRIDKLDETRKEEVAVEMQTLKESYEDMYERKIQYNTAKHEDRRFKHIRTGFETVIGATTIADIVTNEGVAEYKDTDKFKKGMSKLKDLEAISNIEEELRSLNRQLKKERNRYINANASTEEEKQKLSDKLDNQYNELIKETRRMNVRSSDIKEAVSAYMYENNIQKITAEDIDGVLSKLQDKLSDTRTRKIDFPADVKDKIKNALKQKMVDDNKGLGYNTKDAVTTIRKILGKDGILEPQSTSKINDPIIKDLQEQIMQKIKDINTYDEIGKVKYKESLIKMNKIIKDAKKLGK